MSRSLLSPGVLEWRLNRKDYENLLFLPTSNPLILFHLFTHNIKHNIFERWKRYDNWKYISYSLYSYHSHRQWAAQRANRMEPEGNHMTSTPFHCEPEASGGDRRETRPGGDEGPLLHRLICLPPHGPGCYHLIWRKPVRDERLLLTTVHLCHLSLRQWTVSRAPGRSSLLVRDGREKGAHFPVSFLVSASRPSRTIGKECRIL